MGNDGGSIPKRRELVQEAARNPTAAELKEKQLEHQEHHWSHDPLTGKPLASPVVSDALGRLYNKDAIIEYLLPADADEDNNHAIRRAEQDTFLNGVVKRLKDVVEVRFEVDPGVAADSSARREKWICPVTHKELGAATKTVYLVPCGHAFAEAAVREVARDERRCLQCDTPHAPNDVIPILPTLETEVARLMLRVKTLKEQGLAHSLKKDKGESSKKRKKDAVEAKQSAKHASNKKGDKTNGIKDAATASLTARVLAEQDERNKKRKLAGNDNIDSLFTKKNAGDRGGKNVDFMTRGYAIGR
ncbi:hypothetical protein FH972_022254 [Carpinus fangiana]|uniref:Uncharacterized protein n=1 Tax=Carpinus fangiana TaxID=176857 RepID=A0A5N6KTY0_9ROSI|nr:hypothetical protein FH972_022254 [Carpinus fangiana]